jgi:phytoene dehydrogenase-like protein
MDRAEVCEVDVLVAGGGLAGLAAAAAARTAGARSVALLDVRSPGGRARSDVREGFILNQGPHAVYRRGPGAAVLASFCVALKGAPPAKKAYGTKGGRVGILPTSVGSLARSPFGSLSSRARLGRLLLGLPKEVADLAGVSAADWVRGLRLDEDGALVMAMLLRVASYAPDLEVISADAAVSQLRMVVKGGVVYLDGGWQSLVDGLVEAAGHAGASIVQGRVTSLEKAGAGAWSVASSAGGFRAGAVVVATGGPQAAKALVPDLALQGEGEDAVVACLDLGLRRPPRLRVVFGLDSPLYLSTHAPAAELGPPGGSVVHVMRYGARSSDEDRAELWSFARSAGIEKDDVVVERFLHRMVVHHAQPRPGSGLAGRPPVAGAERAGLYLAGDWVGPVGLLGDAALSSGAAAGRAAAEHAASTARQASGAVQARAG